MAEAMADVVLHNVAASGRPTHECLRLYSRLVAPLFDAVTHRNIIAFHAGDNDIAGGRSSSETYAAFRDYVAVAHRQGWKVVVTTELRRADFDSLHEAKLEKYNDQLKGNQAGADAVVDLDADPRLKDLVHRTDPGLFIKDRIHPSDGGYSILAGMLAPEVERVAER